ncbi:AraC family transcriptional regulator [Paenibacillaceae bacterium]|nr:AraC family transcriptional regulator [Paenibacillaceae bacterium]
MPLLMSVPIVEGAALLKAIAQPIGERIGFQSSAYFISTFKKYEGITPNSYRKSMRVGNTG